MIEKDETDILICVRAEGDIRVYPAGTEVRRCAQCEQPIFVAPGGQKLLDDPEKHLRPLCLTCATEHIAEQQELGNQAVYELADPAEAAEHLLGRN